MFLLVWAKLQFSMKIRKIDQKSSPNPSQIPPKISKNRSKIEKNHRKNAPWLKMHQKIEKNAKRNEKSTQERQNLSSDGTESA